MREREKVDRRRGGEGGVHSVNTLRMCAWKNKTRYYRSIIGVWV